MIRTALAVVLGLLVFVGCTVAIAADDVVWSVGALFVAIASGLLLAAVAEE